MPNCKVVFLHAWVFLRRASVVAASNSYALHFTGSFVACECAALSPIIALTHLYLQGARVEEFISADVIRRDDRLPFAPQIAVAIFFVHSTSNASIRRQLIEDHHNHWHLSKVSALQTHATVARGKMTPNVL
jgi:hypothetical protein